MISHSDLNVSEDHSFGPETDLILSLLIIVLLVGVLAFYQGRGRVIEKYENVADMFERKSAVLSDDGKKRLGADLSRYLTLIRNRTYQQIEIIGYASPEGQAEGSRPKADARRKTLVTDIEPGLDVNTALSLERAIAVAAYLNSLGMPPECMKITGYGRGHSALLKEFLATRNAAGRASSGALISGEFDAWAKARDNDLSKERRTEIRGINPGTRTCQILLETTP